MQSAAKTPGEIHAMPPIVAQLMILCEDGAALVAVFDPDDRLRYGNAAFRAAYFVAPDEQVTWAALMRRNFEAGRGAAIASRDIDAWLATAQSARGKTPNRSFEIDLLDGRWLWVNETVAADGWMLMSALDITELQADERELRQHRDMARRASLTDELTGVANRRLMLSSLETLLSGRAETGTGGCVCLLDIDFFKRVNDSYGHMMGDAVLTDFARTVQAKIRRQDTFGRIGGEEFMLILPDASLARGKAIADRVLAAVRNRHPISQDPSFSYTCSAGLAEIRALDTVEAVYSRADQALYQAKNGGRDRLALAA